MLPRKATHDHAKIQRLRPVQLVDLRDYGLERAAPEEDGRRMLVFRLSDDGALEPGA